MSACAECGIPFKGDVIATCSVCLGLFHANSGKGKNCSGCTASEIKVLELKEKKPMMVYRCPACTAIGGEDTSLKAAVSDLQASINELLGLRKDLAELKESIPKLRIDVDGLRSDFDG